MPPSPLVVLALVALALALFAIPPASAGGADRRTSRVPAGRDAATGWERNMKVATLSVRLAAYRESGGAVRSVEEGVAPIPDGITGRRRFGTAGNAPPLALPAR